MFLPEPVLWMLAGWIGFNLLIVAIIVVYEKIFGSMKLKEDE